PNEGHKVEPCHRRTHVVAIDRQREPVRVGDVNQRLRDRARALGRPEAVLVFGNLFRNLQRVVADNAETGGDLFGSVVGHRADCSPFLLRLMTREPAAEIKAATNRKTHISPENVGLPYCSDDYSRPRNRATPTTSTRGSRET